MTPPNSVPTTHYLLSTASKGVVKKDGTLSCLRSHPPYTTAEIEVLILLIGKYPMYSDRIFKKNKDGDNYNFGSSLYFSFSLLGSYSYLIVSLNTIKVQPKS